MVDYFFSSRGYRDYSALLDLVLTVVDDCKDSCGVWQITEKFRSLQQKNGLPEKDVNLAYFFYIDNVLTFKGSDDLVSLDNEFSEYPENTARLMKKLVACGIISVQQLEELINRITFFSLEKIGEEDLKKVVAAIIFSDTVGYSYYNGNMEVN